MVIECSIFSGIIVFFLACTIEILDEWMIPISIQIAETKLNELEKRMAPMSVNLMVHKTNELTI